MSAAAAIRTAERYRAGAWDSVERALPEETPVVIVANGRPFAAVMATPADLEDLVAGFAVTEGLVEDFAEIGRIVCRAVDEGFEAEIAIPEARAAKLEDRRRAFAARTSCSLCGMEGLDMLLARRPARAGSAAAPGVAPEAILAAMAALPAAQTLNAQTRAVHAAGWADDTGRLKALREDVGRHNALDKLIGGLLRDGAAPGAGFVCLTSRCSIEMVLKAAAVGVTVLAAASSPTALAVRAAEAAGVALVACVKADALEVYAGRERLEDGA